MYKNITPEVN